MLTPEEIRANQECDTDDDECEYVHLQKKLYHPNEELKKPEKTEEKKPVEEPSIKTHSSLELEEEEQNEEDAYDELDLFKDDESVETKLLEKALFALQNQIRFTKRISKGVYLVEMRVDNSLQCLKIERRRHRDRKRIPMELRMLGHIKSFPKHRHIQVMNGFVITEYMYAFLSDFAPDLFHSTGLHKRPLEVRAIMRQLLVGLRQLHRNNVIHRDIKMSNVLWDHKKLTIIDFDKSTWNNAKGHHVYVGTDAFLAPETLRFERDGPKLPQRYNEKCDVYSAGVLFGCLLFCVSEDQLKEMHVSMFREDANRYLPPLSAQLLKKMIRYNPVKRPSAHKLLQHAYFTIHK